MRTATGSQPGAFGAGDVLVAPLATDHAWGMDVLGVWALRCLDVNFAGKLSADCSRDRCRALRLSMTMVTQTVCLERIWGERGRWVG